MSSGLLNRDLHGRGGHTRDLQFYGLRPRREAAGNEEVDLINARQRRRESGELNFGGNPANRESDSGIDARKRRHRRGVSRRGFIAGGAESRSVDKRVLAG